MSIGSHQIEGTKIFNMSGRIRIALIKEKPENIWLFRDEGACTGMCVGQSVFRGLAGE